MQRCRKFYAITKQQQCPYLLACPFSHPTILSYHQSNKWSDNLSMYSSENVKTFSHKSQALGHIAALSYKHRYLNVKYRSEFCAYWSSKKISNQTKSLKLIFSRWKQTRIPNQTESIGFQTKLNQLAYLVCSG